ncbi:glycosyltransferase family 2 protein [Salinactinospora qingdaonensis]|uniref:Glycosyltransferase 2-like domain-containing protein n=1 Tax=Salinactinospora qingdaonensis TaxID=702744 RepID=A0ABP7F4F2_9ACTN
MRTARFIGSWLAGLIALSLAVVLFVRWFGYALDNASAGTPTMLLLWLALGVNLLVWGFIGLLRLGDDSVRAVLARRGSQQRRGAAAVHSGRVRTADRHGTNVLVHATAGAGSSREALASAGGAGGTGALAGPTDASASGTDSGEPAPMSLAVIIPAHNEEPVIDAAIQSALRLFNRWDIYVVSDSSRDATADIAAETGVNVLELLSNRGKAGAIEAVISEFDLTDNYDGVVILDADTELDEKYIEGARRQLADPTVAAVAGFVVAEWKPKERSLLGRLISAYRDRLYWLLQYLIRFGQTWRYTSTTFIVPGFASTYRSSVLKQLHINPKGLVIEDFNMTFEVHHKRLGRISMNPGTRAYCQDPFTLSDYVSQVRRWSLGFWQTVRRHGMWPSLFWFALFFYIVEIVLVAVLLLGTAALGVFMLLPPLTGGAALELGWYSAGYSAVGALLPLTAIAVGLLIPDYILTCLMATIRRRPSYLIYGMFFLPMRLIDSYIALRTIPQAWTTVSDGRWKSPGRSRAS